MTNKVVNHWGKWVESETPTTGVISNNSVEWINDECNSGIDLFFEHWRKENPESDSDEYESDESTYLIGDWKMEEGEYVPDQNGNKGFSAITSFDSFNCTQVVWSKWTKRGSLCSPCFPGQVDLDSNGDFLGFTLPPDLIGFQG